MKKILSNAKYFFTEDLDEPPDTLYKLSNIFVYVLLCICIVTICMLPNITKVKKESRVQNFTQITT